MNFCKDCDALLQVRKIEDQYLNYCPDCNENKGIAEVIPKISIKFDNEKTNIPIVDKDKLERMNRIRNNKKALSQYK